MATNNKTYIKNYMQEYRKKQKENTKESTEKNNNKRYYWLKLKEDFFNQKVIKKLRKIAGGDTYTIIYLKMQLASLENNGVLIFEGVEEGFTEELALELDEDFENVRVTLAYLEANKLIEIVEDNKFLLTEVPNITGSECYSAERMRKHRNNKKMSQCDEIVSQCNEAVTRCDEEIEKEIEKEIDIYNTGGGIDNINNNIYGCITKNNNTATTTDNIPELDNDNFIRFYRSYINPVASMYELEKLTSWAEDVSPCLIKKACEVAIESNARNYKYINAILNRCLEQGITTRKQYEDAEKIRKEQKNYEDNNRNDTRESKKTAKTGRTTKEEWEQLLRNSPNITWV